MAIRTWKGEKGDCLAYPRVLEHDWDTRVAIPFIHLRPHRNAEREKEKRGRGTPKCPKWLIEGEKVPKHDGQRTIYEKTGCLANISQSLLYETAQYLLFLNHWRPDRVSCLGFR